MRHVLPLLAISAALVAGVACNRRVFEQVEPTCDPTIASDKDVPVEKAADILIVVDNSNSMREEQENLATNFVNPNVGTNAPAQCPIDPDRLADFARCKEDDPPAICQWANPPSSKLEPGGELSGCGFIQVLAAFENDFRVGVITTDVGVCDNRSPAAQGGAYCARSPAPAECTSQDVCNPSTLRCEGSNAGCATDGECGLTWGYRPQRGCLQPNGPPGTEFKVIARSDLEDTLSSNDDIGDRFTRTLNNISVHGTGFERGLDAMRDFLDASNVDTRDERCRDDLANFLRDDAKLVVIFLTDEQDCSRLPGNDALLDEFAEQTCGPAQPPRGVSAGQCYDAFDAGELTAVDEYVEFLRQQKKRVDDISVAVIAGGVRDGDDTVGGGCTQAGGQPDGTCWPSRGRSVGDECSAAPRDINVRKPVAEGGRGCVDEEGRLKPCELACCQADSGSRYFELADAFPDQSIKDSICYDSFRETMIKIAVKIGDDESVRLAEAPANDALIFVEKAPRDSNEYALVQRIVDSDCQTADGWYLDAEDEENIRVRFCGDARPGPGERIRVRAKGVGADPAGGADACVNRGG